LGVAAGAVSWAKGSATWFLLFAALFAGWLRIEAWHGERSAAENVVAALSDGRPRAVAGFVAASADSSGEASWNITLRDVVVTSGVERIRVPGRLRLSLVGAATKDLTPFVAGERIAFAAPVEFPPTNTNQGLYDFREVLALSRVYTWARVRSPAMVERVGDAAGLPFAFARALIAARQTVVEAVRRHVPHEQADLVTSLIFNDRRLMTPDERAALRDSGLMHIFAVSGLHVAILAMIILIALRVTGLRPRWAWLLAVVAITPYLVILDFIPPAARAYWMLVAYALGRLLGREQDGISTLTLAVAIILLADPLAAFQPSFILSFACVAGLVAFAPLFADLWGRDDPPEGWREHITNCARQSMTATAAITLGVLPLQFYYYQQFNLLSPLANLLAAAVSAPLLGGSLATVAADLLVPVAAPVIGRATAFLMRATVWLAEVTAAQHWAIVHTAKPAVWGVCGYYLVLVSGYYFVRRDTPEFRPKSLARLLIHSPAAVLLLALASYPWTRGTLRLWFLDVGQGDAAIIEFPSGQTLLVDGGNIQPDMGQRVVEPALRVRGIRPLGEALATHDDADHVGGLVWITSRYPVLRLVEGAGKASDGGLMTRVRDHADRRRVERVQVAAGQTAQLGPATFVDVLNPSPDTPTADNDRSVVLRVRHGRFSAVLMGDAGEAVEQRMIADGSALPTDVLKVSHHGSRTGTSDAFLAALAPRVAVVSCGRNNRYGHPHPEVIQRLDRHGAEVYRTDRDGGIVIETDGQTFRVGTARRRAAD
jgi:competence protein ComEC